MPLDPNWMHRIRDCSPDSIDELVGLLAGSWRREHWLYREAELDDLWRWSEMEAWAARVEDPTGPLVDAYRHVHDAAFIAHNLAAYGRLQDAIVTLEAARNSLRVALSAAGDQRAKHAR